MAHKARQLREGVLAYRAGFASRFRMMTARFNTSLREIASPELRVPQGALSRIQHERTVSISWGSLSRIVAFALAHGVNLHWLLSGLGPMELPAADPNGTTTRAHQDGRLTVNPQSAIRNPQCDDGTTRARQDGRLTGGDSDRV
jgi:hypothetical protein